MARHGRSRAVARWMGARANASAAARSAGPSPNASALAFSPSPRERRAQAVAVSGGRPWRRSGGPSAGGGGGGLGRDALEALGEPLGGRRVEAHGLAAAGDRRQHLRGAVGEQQQ